MPPLSRLALRLTGFTERWLPDAFVFALLATVLAIIGGLTLGHASTGEIVKAWGDGFWGLIPFTMQMALVVITGTVVATARPMARAIDWLAARPRTDRGAIVFVAVLGMAAAWLNWGFGLVFGAVLARAIARRRPSIDYRTLAATVMLGAGSIWAQGLSGSAALQMATTGALQPAIRHIVESGGGPGSTPIPGGMIPLTATIFLTQSLISVLVEIVVVAIAVWLLVPTGASVKTAADLGVDPDRGAASAEAFVDEGPTSARAPEAVVNGAVVNGAVVHGAVVHGAVVNEGPTVRHMPGEWLETRPWLTWLVVVLAAAYLVSLAASAPSVAAAVTLNTLNLAFLTVGMLLHGTPARFIQAFKSATPHVSSVILQFPFYAGIAAIITDTGLNARLASLFTGAATHTTFPALVAAYSAVLGVFVPSGGSKWVIEAPYVLQAAHNLKVHLGWTVVSYDLGEALANLIQPFWMLPVLGILGLKARDVIGVTFTIFLVLAPVVLILVTVLGGTLGYPL
ncbi:MAG: TIGR00366 family protein [Gemmatimonadota bacterium]